MAALIGGVGGGAVGGGIAFTAGWMERRHSAREERLAATRAAGAGLDGHVRHLVLRVQRSAELRAHPVRAAIRSFGGEDLIAVREAVIDCLGPIIEAQALFKGVAPDLLLPLSTDLLATVHEFATMVDGPKAPTSDAVDAEMKRVIDEANRFRAGVRLVVRPAELARADKARLSEWLEANPPTSAATERSEP